MDAVACVCVCGGGVCSTPIRLPGDQEDVPFHPILNLRDLNPYLLLEKFRMETLTSILRDVCPGMWMISLDLKDAYPHVLIPRSHRKFLRFALKDQCRVLRAYQWGVLPFHLAMVPQLFTKLLGPVAAH